MVRVKHDKSRGILDARSAEGLRRYWPSGTTSRRNGRVAEALAHDEDTAAIAVIESFLRSRITARIAGDRNITRVEQIVEEFAMTTRRLQRLFRDYVDVTPKWVQRYRLIEAAERIDSGAADDLAALALDLGYADQVHFIRDFRTLVGRPPAGYRRSLRANAGRRDDARSAGEDAGAPG